MRIDLKEKIKNPIFWAGIISQVLNLFANCLNIHFNIEVINYSWFLISNLLITLGVFINPNTKGIWDYDLVKKEVKKEP